MQIVALEPNSHEHNTSLYALGLKLEWLQEIGARILTAFSQTTRHDALNAPGSYAYFAAVRSTRDILCLQGWSVYRQSNLELIRHEKKDISLLVSSGDKYTGDKDVEPSTKNPKGTQTIKIVVQNSQCLYLFPEMNEPFLRKPESSPTWFLLYHIDPFKEKMHMELSLPTSFDKQELKVYGWRQRLLLPDIDFSSSSITIAPDFTTDPVIEVRRKSND